MTTSVNITDDSVGHVDHIDRAVATGTCSYCGRETTLRQMGKRSESEIHGNVVPVRCDGCLSLMVLKLGANTELLPPPKISGKEDLPDQIDNYYQEALDCISVGAPNGAATLFRKTIHAISIHYGIAEVSDSMSIYKMIDKLAEEGHLNPKLRSSLLAVKDIGNDGAHINENEPEMNQILAIKELIDAVLESTVITDKHIDTAREAHPNEFEDSE